MGCGQQAGLANKKVALEKSICITWFLQGICSRYILCHYSDSERVCVCVCVCVLEVWGFLCILRKEAG